MKDSKTVRTEHQSFVDAYKQINESSAQDKPVEEGYKSKEKKTKKEEMVLVRKSNAFTALAEKYNMSPKQFGRYVEANQHLFDIPTRKKAILANKFQGFKETKEWDEFFGDLELVEGAPYTVNIADKKGNTPAYQNYKKGMLNKLTGKPLYKAGVGLEKASYEPEGEELQEITTKDTKSGTKFKVRVKDKKTNSSYIRFATRDKIAQLRSDPKIASVEMTDEGQTPEERGEKKAQAAGGGSPKKKADKDHDGDGKVESPTAEYKGSKDKAIKKAIKKRSVTTEDSDINEALPLAPLAVAAGGLGVATYGGKLMHDAFKDRNKNKKTKVKKEELSNWREDLKEIVGEVEKTEGKKSKSKSKKVKNGVCINPDTDDDKNKYEEVNAQKVAEGLGAELQSLKIEDADGKVAYEVIDLVKPDPIKETNVMLTYKSGQGVDASIGGRSVRNTFSNIKTGANALRNIKSDGLVGGIKKTINNNKTTTTTKPSISSNIDSALKNYKSTISSSYEMETEDLQQTVTNILDKGSNFMKNTKVGRVLGKVFGPSNPKNKGSDYTKDGKVAR